MIHQEEKVKTCIGMFDQQEQTFRVQLCVFVLLRVCCQRSWGRRRTLARPPSRCWSIWKRCRTSSTCTRPRETGSTRRRESEPWTPRSASLPPTPPTPELHASHRLENLVVSGDPQCFQNTSNHSDSKTRDGNMPRVLCVHRKCGREAWTTR